MRQVYLLLALSCCLACSRPPGTFNNPNSARAMLNDSAWFGRATAVEAGAINDNPCAAGRFTVFIATDLGYPGDKLRLSPEIAVMQAGEFVPRQRLTFCNIPTKTGSYRVSELNRCGSFVLMQGNFALLGNGSSLVGAYFVQTTKTNRVRIVKIDSVARTITGRFNITLADSSGRVARFRRGLFIARLPKK